MNLTKYKLNDKKLSRPKVCMRVCLCVCVCVCVYACIVVLSFIQFKVCS